MSILATILLIFVFLPIHKHQAQDKSDNLRALIHEIVTDKELNEILFSYEHNGDHPLFIAYNDAIRRSIDSAEYTDQESWRYEINMNFGNNAVYIRSYAFLLGHLVKYYLQFDAIQIDNGSATIQLRSKTTDVKVEQLSYFVGQIRFQRKNHKWQIVRKRIEAKEPR